MSEAQNNKKSKMKIVKLKTKIIFVRSWGNGCEKHSFQGFYAIWFEKRGTNIFEDLAAAIIITGSDIQYKWMTPDYYSLMLAMEKSETKSKKGGEIIIHYTTILHRTFKTTYYICTRNTVSWAIQKNTAVHTK